MGMTIKGHEIVRLISDDIFNKASTMAINRGMATTTARMKDTITSKYNVKRKDIVSRVNIIKANKNRQEGRIIIPHQPLGLIYFGARPVNKGVSYAILKGRRTTWPHAFISNIRGNGEQVYERYGEKVSPLRQKIGRGKNWKRQRIRRLMGMSISQMFLGKNGKNMQQTLQPIFNEAFHKELITASKYLVGKR